jgi:hypothetical protein
MRKALSPPVSLFPGRVATTGAWGYGNSVAQKDPGLLKAILGPGACQAAGSHQEVKFEQRPPSLHWFQCEKPEPKQNTAQLPDKCLCLQNLLTLALGHLWLFRQGTQREQGPHCE